MMERDIERNSTCWDDWCSIETNLCLFTFCHNDGCCSQCLKNCYAGVKNTLPFVVLCLELGVFVLGLIYSGMCFKFIISDSTMGSDDDSLDFYCMDNEYTEIPDLLFATAIIVFVSEVATKFLVFSNACKGNNNRNDNGFAWLLVLVSKFVNAPLVGATIFYYGEYPAGQNPRCADASYYKPAYPMGIAYFSGLAVVVFPLVAYAMCLCVYGCFKESFDSCVANYREYLRRRDQAMQERRLRRERENRIPAPPPAVRPASEVAINPLQDQQRRQLQQQEEQRRAADREKEEFMQELRRETEACRNVERALEEMQVTPIDFEVLSKWTSNFSSQEKIESGGFGDVYRGIFKKSGNNSDFITLTVKRMPKLSITPDHVENNQAMIIRLEKEVGVLTSFRHANLIPLVAYSLPTETQSAEVLSKFCLAYEMVSKSNLARMLADPGHAALLDWRRRLKIALGISCALNYLHNKDSMSPAYHRDIKSTNIVLTENYSPKLVDWGLAKYINTTGAAVFGTPGYICEYYMNTGRYDAKCEVYSFGVVLAELVTGFVQNQPGNDLKPVFLKHDIRVLPPDPRVTDWPEALVTALRSLAMDCMKEYSDRIPNMLHVVRTLKSLCKEYPPLVSAQHSHTEQSSVNGNFYAHLNHLVTNDAQHNEADGVRLCVHCWDRVSVDHGVMYNYQFLCSDCFTEETLLN